MGSKKINIVEGDMIFFLSKSLGNKSFKKVRREKKRP